MRFRTKLFIIWGGLVLALSAGTLVPSLRMISASFERAAVSNFAGTRHEVKTRRAEHLDRMRQAGRLLMSIPDLRALIAEHNFEVSSDNVASLQERLDSLRELVGVGFLCVIDGRGALVAQSRHSPWESLGELGQFLSTSPQPRAMLGRLFAGGATGDQCGLWVYHDRLYEVVGLPLIFGSSDDGPPRPDGALLMAVPWTDELVTELGSSHGCEVNLLAEGGAASLASSLPAAQRADVVTAYRTARWPASTSFDLRLRGTDYRCSIEPLTDPCSGTTVGGMLIQSSQADAIAARHKVSRDLLLISIAGLAAAGAVSFLLSGAVTRPVARLVGGVQRVAAGDLESSLPVGRPDELGELATAFNDMVAQLRARRELERQVEESRAASRAKSQFLANMSHELRTPLHGVIGMADLLLRTPLEDRQRHYAQLVRSSAALLTTLINDLLDFSKIEAGKLEIETIDFEPRGQVEDVIELLAERAAGKGLELLCYIHPAVPRTGRGDPSRVRQVLMNLIGNAIKFTAAGSVLVRVEPDETATTQVRFSVTDTGEGIPPDRMDRLFKSFSQVDASTSRRHGGTGLGLAISKQLVELMGGQIGVQSERGRGSTFWFTLDLQSPPSTPGDSPLRGVRALVVQANDTAREVLARKLADAGADSSAAPTAVAANELLAGTAFQVVLVDARLPAIETLTQSPKTAIVWLAEEGRPTPDGIRLPKPIRQSQLVSAVQDAIDPTRAAAAAAKGSGRRVAGPELPKAAQAYRLLVAEDQEVNQIVARELLTEAGYRCDVVGDGAAAVRAAAAERYDLVLMDCQMPTMDGFEATQRIRASESQSPARRRLPIIALTANASGADRGRCMAAGMDGYCGKPFEPLELLTMIGGFLSGKAPAAPPTPPAPQEPAEGPFNLTKLLRQCSGKPALAAMVLEKFDAQTADTLVQLRRVAADLDMSGVARLSHALKGTAGVIAADGLWQAAARLEALGRAGDAALLDQTLRELCNEAERCRAHVEQTKAQFTPAAARVEERT